MRTQFSCLPSTTSLLVTLLIVLSGCSRSDAPDALAKNPEAGPAGGVALAPRPAVETAQTSPTTTKHGHKVTIVDLPAPIDKACVGAGGTLLVLRLKDQGKLMVFDPAGNKIVGQIPLSDPQDLFAAGAEKLLTVGRKNRQVKRYSLGDLKQEAEFTLPGTLPIAAAGMGASSRGPLYVHCESTHDVWVMAVDPTTQQLLEPKKEKRWLGSESMRVPACSSVSGDGSVVCVWSGRHFPQEAYVVCWRDDHTESYPLRPCRSYACPDDRGERIYADYKVFKFRGVVDGFDDHLLAAPVLPAVGGPYYMTIPSGTRLSTPVHRKGSEDPPPSTEPSPETNILVYLVDEAKPICAIPAEDFPLVNAKPRHFRENGEVCWRLFLLPAAKVITELPATGNTLILHHLDMEEQLQRGSSDDPLVLSRPPTKVRLGETLRYQIQTRSKSGKPVFKLDSGPKGMVVSDTGLVEWTPSPEFVSSAVGAVVSIGDSGRNKFHTLALTVQPSADLVAAAGDGPPPGSWPGDKPTGNLRLRLPAAYEDVCVGGNGRYLVFTLPTLKKVAVFDVTAAKIIGFVPVADECLVAAGMDKLVVVHPKQSVIERFSLQTQKLESKQPLTLSGEAMCAGMGSASHGPVMVVAAKDQRLSQIVLLDLDSLARLEYRKEKRDAALTLPPGSHVCTSAEGHVFCIRGAEASCVLALTGQELKWRDIRSFYGWMVPDETGDRIFSIYGIAGDRFRKPIGPAPHDPDRSPESCFIPAVHGPLYLQLKPQRYGYTASLYLADEDKPLASLRDIPFPGVPLVAYDRLLHRRYERHTLDRRVFLLPDAKVIALLPEGQEQIVLCRFDLDGELKRSGVDYLTVVSRPPHNSPPGKIFEYQLDVRSKAGNVQCRLDSGPNGMQVSPAGLVRWDVKSLPETAIAKVQITVTDGSGKSVPHHFELTAREEPKLALAAPGTSDAVPQRSARDEALLLPRAIGLEHGQWQLTKIDDRRLGMPPGDVMLAPGLNYQSMLLLQGEHLAVLSADGMKVLKTHKLGAKYHGIGERAEYYVAIKSEPSAIDVLDKKTLTTIRSVSGKEWWWPSDLALHPTRPVSYVAIVRQGMSTNGSFVILDETRGKIRGSPEYLGQWIEVDAAGQRLVAAGPYIGAGKPDLLLVPRPGPDGLPMVSRPAPGGALPVPHTGEHGGWYTMQRRPGRWIKDVLAVYSLVEDETPLLSKSISLLPGAANELRMAPDGRRATGLGTVGNIDAIKLDTPDESPIQYAMSRAKVLDVAYHPVLPLVACLGETGPAIFERETGKLLPDSMKSATVDLEDAKFHRLWFSADGQGLLLDIDVPAGHRLYRVELALSPTDRDRVRQRLPNMTSLGRDLLVDRTPAPGSGTVPLAAIEAFKGGRSQEISAKDVGRLFTDAVVIVRSGEGSSTGFVVGSSGYILTCAHGLREADGITVSCRSGRDKHVEMKNTPAKLLRIDHAKDLALLKIEGVASLPTVRLFMGGPVETGERVTVIGNPGAGKTLLEYTMTEGIVSNPRRRFGSQVLIQVSAAVNPGCSGGPLFNERGLVIGLVVLKAKIDRAGFAVPASELASFLATTVKATGPEAALQRQWVDADGTHEFAAQFLAVRDGAVQLRRADGKEISVPWAKLSPQDQAFVRLFHPDAVGK